MHKKIKTLITFLVFWSLHSNGQVNQISFRELDAAAINMKRIHYKNADLDSLNLLYQAPIQTFENKKFPAIVFIHGGAWTGGTAETFAPYAAYFSLRNIVGISIEYRLLKDEKSDILNCIADCKSAIRYIKTHSKELQIDTNKIVICGESAGGHLAACMELLEGYNDPSDDATISTKPYALLLLNPVVNLATNTFIKYLDAHLVKNKQVALDSTTLFSRYADKAKAISPFFQVQKKLPPTLLINGEKDVVTPASYAIQFSNQANRLGSNCKLLLMPETGHAFAVPHYKESEQKTVHTLIVMDQFLHDLKIISGNPIIMNGNDPNWIHKR